MVSIRLFKSPDLEAVASIFAQSFEGKLGYLSKLSPTELPQFGIDSGFIPTHESAGYWVAEAEGQVAGVMKLKSALLPGPEPDISIRRLVVSYGAIQTVKTLAAALILDTKPQVRNCYVEFVAVSAHSRGLGIGSQLLDRAQELAASLKGCRCVSLEVAAHNQAATRLYERLGFKTVKPRSSWLTQKLLGIGDWLYMERPVAGS